MKRSTALIRLGSASAPSPAKSGRRGRLALAICASMLISSLCFAQQQTPSPSAPTKITGKAAIEALIGNTMTGSADGTPYLAFYAKDGTVTMKRGGEVSSGKWSINGDDLCEEYPDDEDESCYKLELDGTAGVMTDEDGTPYKIEILPGNPEKL
ncbi:hypothetical protein SAMN05444161_4991 [Rhizobiales bacterium GAS191]|nr:hypothetical protein SAMN05444161_4991 [Rhizobiales bacterium GAS191]